MEGYRDTGKQKKNDGRKNWIEDQQAEGLILQTDAARA